jgi:hypothetical protein
VQWTNGQYYPAAIYLGGADQAVVRVIDSGVVDLINRAEASGNDGGNHTGGGVIRIDRGSSTAGSWKLIVNLGPSEAVLAGAKWKGGTRESFSASAVDFNSCGAGETVRTLLEFLPIPGWELPTYSTNIDLICGVTTTLEVLYAPVRPQLLLDQNGLRLFGTPASYHIDMASNLGLPMVWTPLTTIVLSNSTLVLTNLRPNNTGQRFYRARWTP